MKPARWLKQLIALVVVLGAWQTVYALDLWPAWVFPGPVSVAKELWSGLTDGSYLVASAISLRRLMIGFAISVIVGGVLGFALARLKLVRESIGWLVLSLQSLPSICWLPLALLWFGLNESAILFVVVMGSLLSVTLSVQGAIEHIPPLWIRAGKMLGARRLQLYRHVLMPAILPELITGLKQGWSFAWRSLMAGEMLFITAGLGELLMVGREFHDMSRVLAVMVTIMLLGVLVDKLVFSLAEQVVYRRWGLKR